MALPVVFSERAESQLRNLLFYLSQEASLALADRHVGGIVDFCLSLGAFPHKGMLHPELRPNLRIISYARRVTIGYTADDARVLIVGIYTGGQNYMSDLADEIH